MTSTESSRGSPESLAAIEVPAGPQMAMLKAKAPRERAPQEERTPRNGRRPAETNERVRWMNRYGLTRCERGGAVKEQEVGFGVR